MLIDDEKFHDGRSIVNQSSEPVCRYSSFSDFSVEGGEIAGAFLNCEFSNIDWYWGIFNICVFVACRFEGCTFRGTSFPDCRFVDCEFTRCEFVQDNLGADCKFENSKWYGCSQNECEGLKALS
jgi:uncharacterized protein YjbI with pentapeptide repeats